MVRAMILLVAATLVAPMPTPRPVCIEIGGERYCNPQSLRSDD